MSTQMPLERANELHGTPNQANGDVAQAHGTVQPSHSASSLPQHAAPLSLPQIFSDLKFPTNAAHHLKTLGRGAFSKVKLAISRSTGEPLAVKIVDKEEMRYKAAKAREQRARAKARAKRMNGDHHVTVDAYRHHLHGRHHEEHIHHSTASLPTPHLPALVRNLLPEPQLLLLLSHRNIVRLLSVAESPSWCLVAMEYLPHGDLSCLVPPRAEPLSERKARNYFRQLLLALHHAHAKGVVHRDLKPENVMLGDWLPGEPGTGESAPREKRGLSSPATLNDEEAREPEKGQDAEGCWRVVVADFGLGRGRWKSWGTKGKLMPEHPQGESNNEEIAEETEEDEIDEEMQVSLPYFVPRSWCLRIDSPAWTDLLWNSQLCLSRTCFRPPIRRYPFRCLVSRGPALSPSSSDRPAPFFLTQLAKSPLQPDQSLQPRLFQHPRRGCSLVTTNSCQRSGTTSNN